MASKMLQKTSTTQKAKSHVNVMKIQAHPHVSCDRYAWTRRVAGPCSATCGGGVRAVVWVCGDTRADTYHKVGTANESCYNGLFPFQVDLFMFLFFNHVNKQVVYLGFYAMPQNVFTGNKVSNQ